MKYQTFKAGNKDSGTMIMKAILAFVLISYLFTLRVLNTQRLSRGALAVANLLGAISATGIFICLISIAEAIG